MGKLELILKIILSLVFPITLIIFLNNDDYIYQLSVLTISLLIFFNFSKNNFIMTIITVTVIIYIYLSIIIIPYSYYQAWFSSIIFTIPKGVVTKILTSTLILIWTYSITQFKVKNISSYLFITIFLSLFISLSNDFLWLIPVIIILLIIAVIIPLYSKLSFKRFIIISITLLFFLLISFLNFQRYKYSGSKRVNNSSYFTRQIIDKYFPFIELLTPIPGVKKVFQSRTGRPPVLTDNAILELEAEFGEIYYLRLEVNDEPYSIVEKQYQNNNLTTNSLKITILSDFLPVLPTTLNVLDSNRFFIESTDKTLVPEKTLLKGDKIILHLGESNLINSSPEISIPKSSNRMIKLAQKLKGNDDLETAYNIRHYLNSDDFSYTLEVEESFNYIEDFLFNNKKGFCVHYTRAFIELALLNEIPVREISGYRVNSPYPDEFSNNNLKNIVKVTGLNSHLWPEIFTNGRWITFEVTKPFIINEISKPLEQVTLSNDISSVEDNNEYGQNNFKFYILLGIIIILLINISGFIIYRNFYYKNYIKRIIYKYRKLKNPHPKEIGWENWCKLAKIDHKIKLLILHKTYNDHVFTKEEEKILIKYLKNST